MRLARAGAGLGLALAACGGSAVVAPSSQAAWFVECAAERGLDFHHENGHRERYYMPEIVGGGGALFDMESDGDLDAYLVQSGSLYEDADPSELENHLFANDGRGRFRDVTSASGAEDRRFGMGVACADADGDGHTDLFVTNVGRNTLLVNDGRGCFRDTSVAAGLVLEGWNTSAAFLDVDRDGALDVFVARYLEWSMQSELTCMNPLGQKDYCSPKNYKSPARALLLHNLGQGRFEDVSRASGVAADAGTGLGVATGDLDGDGWPDVFVANDGMPNHLWKNLHDGRFENAAMLAGCGVDSNGVPKAGMGVVVADLDEDLDLDVLVCNLRGESDSYYRNEGGFFSDRTSVAGLARPSKPFTRFGIALADFDQDGRLDLYEANGRVERPREPVEGNPYAEPNMLLAGQAQGLFAEVTPRGGTQPALVAISRAAVQGDVDGDGALDLLVVNNDGRAHLLLNRVERRGNWALLRVLERNGAHALGAMLEIELGGRRLRRDVTTGFGYLSSHDPRVHLGLGALERIDGVAVRWADGTRERFGPLAAGSEHVLARGRGTPP